MKNLPKLHINTGILRSNLQRIQKKLAVMSVDLRPHVKTIHDPALSSVLTDLGIDKISVSNIDMLQAFVVNGWQDVCLAFPFSMEWVDDVNHLITDFPDLKLTLYVDHLDQFHALRKLKKAVQVCVEIDSGHQRSGFHWKHETRVLDCIKKLSDSEHEFSGLTSHFGFLYQCLDKDEILAESMNPMMKLLQLKEHLEVELSQSIPVIIGDTPSLYAMDYFDQISEIRAGNFQFNDLMMHQKGLCSTNDLACVIEAVVVSKYDEDSRFVLHCGSVHLSKDAVDHPHIKYGWIAKKQGGWFKAPFEDTWIDQLFQEHAVVKTKPDLLKNIKVGDTVFVLPAHACLTMDAMYHKQRVHFVNL